MAGCDLLRPYAIGHGKKLVELDEVVAKRAGDWCAARQVIGDKRLDDLLLEAIFEVHHVVRDAEFSGDRASIVYIIERTTTPHRTTFGREFRQPALVPELHCEPDNSMPCPVEQCCDNRAVYAAGHGDCDRLPPKFQTLGR